MTAAYARRLWLAAHATVPLGLLATTLLQHWAPAAWSPLHSRPAWPTWAALGAWAVAALLLACWPRGVAMWRSALVATASLMAAAAVAGGVAGAAGWAGFSAALAAGSAAAACCALGLRDAVPPGAARRAAVPCAPRHRPAPLRWWPALSFVVAAVCGVYAFWVARSTAPPLERAGGMAGMLVAFFLLLPAATVRAWSARCAAALLLVASALLAGLAWRTGGVVWSGWAMAAMGLAGAVSWRARRIAHEAACPR